MVRFNLVITLLLMISIAVKAELTNRMFDVRHVGYAEGLSSQRVFSIVEDGDGAMWIATKTGIDRYNGHTVKNYDLPGSFYYGDLAGRRLYLLYDAQQGLFAYDHTGRIYRYSTILDHFEQVLHLGQLIQEEVILNKLCLDSDGTWWMGADKGLYKQEADHRIVAVLKGQYVNDIAFAGESLFVGTSNGVWQLSHTLPDIVLRQTEKRTLDRHIWQRFVCDEPRHFQSACAGGTREHVPSSDTGNYRL